MLTIAGGIVIASIFLAAPGFFIMAGFFLLLFALGAGVLVAFWKEIISHAWWIIGFLVVISNFSGNTSEKKK
jgi:hypothetical protein